MPRISRSSLIWLVTTSTRLINRIIRNNQNDPVASQLEGLVLVADSQNQDFDNDSAYLIQLLRVAISYIRILTQNNDSIAETMSAYDEELGCEFKEDIFDDLIP